MEEKKKKIEIRHLSKSGRVSLSIDGLHHSFDAAGLDRLLAGLGKARARLKDKVPADIEGGSMDVLKHPAWRTMSIPLSADPLLHVRDTRFGWLHYALSRDSARAMAAELTKLATAPAPASVATKQ